MSNLSLAVPAMTLIASFVTQRRRRERPMASPSSPIGLRRVAADTMKGVFVKLPAVTLALMGAAGIRGTSNRPMDTAHAQRANRRSASKASPSHSPESSRQ